MKTLRSPSTREFCAGTSCLTLGHSEVEGLDLPAEIGGLASRMDVGIYCTKVADIHPKMAGPAAAQLWGT